MTKAVAIRADGDVREVELSTPPTLDECQSFIGGGWLEAVPCDFDGDTLFADEDGKGKGYPLNIVATLITRSWLSPTDMIVGDVLLVGKPDPATGETTDVTTTPDEIRQYAQRVLNAVRDDA